MPQRRFAAAGRGGYCAGMPDPVAQASFLPPVLIFCAAAVVAVPLFRRLGLARRARLSRRRHRHRPVRPVAHRRARDRPRRRRARRRAPALHRRARAQAVAADLDAPRHLRARRWPSSAVTALVVRRRRGRERACAATRRRRRDRAGAVGDRDRPADARGARRPADAPTASAPSRSCCSRTSRSRRSSRCCRCSRRPGRPRADAASTMLIGGRDRASPRSAPSSLVGRYGLNPFFRLLASSGAREVMTASALLVVLGAALRHAAGRPVDGDGRLPRRRAARRIELPPPARSRHRAVPRHPARAVLHERRHVDRRRRSCASTGSASLARDARRRSPSRLAIVAVLFRIFGSPWREAVRGGALLAPAGEFAFVLLPLGGGLGLLTPPTAQLVDRARGADHAVRPGRRQGARHRARAPPRREPEPEPDGFAGARRTRVLRDRLRPVRPGRQSGAARRRAST